MKKLSLTLITLSLILTMLSGCLAACNPSNGDTDSTTVSTDDAEVTTVGGVTDNGDVTTDEQTTADVTTDEQTTTESEVQTNVVDVVWNFGYVGSSAHKTYPNAINYSGTYYSYSDVIHISKAGTTISFVDDNTNSNGDTNFCSASAYVISSWKQEGDMWVFDSSGVNCAGAGSSANDVATPIAGGIQYSYTTVQDDEYIRLCFRSGHTSTFTPPAWPVVTIEYTGESSASSVRVDFNDYIANKKQNLSYPELKGLTMNVIGDSYFYGHTLNTDYVWVSQLAAIYDMNFLNSGANGSALCAYDPSRNPMIDRYSNITKNNPDIIIIEGGKNDYNVSAPIGENTDTSKTTFKGALNAMIKDVKSKCPDAFVVCITPWKLDGTKNSAGLTVQDYADAMIEVAALNEVYCINASDPNISGVDMTDSSFRAQYCLTANDISHLNLEGHKYVLPKFEKAIAEAYKASKN